MITLSDYLEATSTVIPSNTPKKKNRITIYMIRYFFYVSNNRFNFLAIIFDLKIQKSTIKKQLKYYIYPLAKIINIFLVKKIQIIIDKTTIAIIHQLFSFN